MDEIKQWHQSKDNVQRLEKELKEAISMEREAWSKLQRYRSNALGFIFDASLTVREQEILGYVCQAKTDKEISQATFISYGTVKFHIRNLLRKTGTRSRVELMLRETKK
jgi:DNA-binding CsgD family transcriptional regulator